MEFIITGVNGYIGSKIAIDLLKSKQNVIGLDITYGNSSSLANNSCFQFHKADITNVSTFSSEIKEANILIHCAALVHKQSSDLSRENYFRVNFEGTVNILNFLNINKIKQIIFLSTVSVYGDISNGIAVDEKTKPDPIDFYGESKLAAENAIKEFSYKHKIPYTIFRLTPVYGNGFLLNIHKRIYLPRRVAFYKIGSGEQHLSLCSINNVVDVVMESINNSFFYNQTFIVKDADDYTINQLIYFFRKLNLQKSRPVVTIPVSIAIRILQFFSVLMPKKSKYYKYQFNKITRDSIYSIKKLCSTGFFPKWNLYNTFKNEL